MRWYRVKKIITENRLQNLELMTLTSQQPSQKFQRIISTDLSPIF